LGGRGGGGGGGGDAGGRSVYVGNLTFEVEWQDLKDHMRASGDVLCAEVMTMHDSRSKGCSIVEYANINGVNRAIKELNDSELMGRKIFVREDRERGGGGGNGA
jgi:RNA recognition motif-containing protein